MPNHREKWTDSSGRDWEVMIVGADTWHGYASHEKPNGRFWTAQTRKGRPTEADARTELRDCIEKATSLFV